MNADPWLRRATGVILLLAACALSGTPVEAQRTAQGSTLLGGRSLTDALRTLQARGLRIVFTSATVKPAMRVRGELRGATARQQLDELLAPHGLVAREGPGGTLQVVRAPRPATGAPKRASTSSNAIDSAVAAHALATTRYREHVTVRRRWPSLESAGVASVTTLRRSELARLQGTLTDDPIRAVHALPRVSAVDDFRTEFAVRGSPFRQVDVVVDGVSAGWLQHTARGRGATGSLAMLAGQLLDEATLRAGAYPRRYGDKLGAQLDLTLREGSRSRRLLRGYAGAANATVVGEGPLGPSGRGSWLVAVRQSYGEWPPEREESTRTGFGFADGLAKVVYDIGPNDQLGLTALTGMSRIDAEDNLAPNELASGGNRASLVSLSWHSALRPSLVLSQQAYVVRQHSLNRYQTGQTDDGTANEEVVYRTAITRPVADGFLEAGAQLGRSAVHAASDVPGADAVAGSSWLRSGYAHFVWSVRPTLTLSPGLRVSDATLVSQPAVAPWLLCEWAFGRGWTLNASAGQSQQMPELRHAIGRRASSTLAPERALHLDAAIAQRVTTTVRWQATVFNRTEADILRDPEGRPRLVGNAIATDSRGYDNALRGSSRGIELLLERRSATGLSGWAAYSYSMTRHTDSGSRETFWGDFDQRHAVNLFAAYRLSDRTSVGATFRAGSNFPIPGYFASRDGQLFVGARRNEVRLPAYARLDIRADRKLELAGRRLTLFGEVLNVLNRSNVGLGSGSVDLSTGAAAGFTDSLLRRRASLGVLVEF